MSNQRRRLTLDFKGTIREAEAKARYHEARAQGKPIEMPDY